MAKCDSFRDSVALINANKNIFWLHTLIKTHLIFYHHLIPDCSSPEGIQPTVTSSSILINHGLITPEAAIKTKATAPLNLPPFVIFLARLGAVGEGKIWGGGHEGGTGGETRLSTKTHTIHTRYPIRPLKTSRHSGWVTSIVQPALWMCAVLWTWWEGEKFPQRRVWNTERRCLPPLAQSLRLLCGFADFFILFYKLFSGTEERFWARGCSHRSFGFCMSCLFAFSKEALSGEAHRRARFPVCLCRASLITCLTLNFPIRGVDAVLAVRIIPICHVTDFGFYLLCARRSLRSPRCSRFWFTKTKEWV